MLTRFKNSVSYRINKKKEKKAPYVVYYNIQTFDCVEFNYYMPTNDIHNITKASGKTNKSSKHDKYRHWYYISNIFYSLQAEDVGITSTIKDIARKSINFVKTRSVRSRYLDPFAKRVYIKNIG